MTATGATSVLDPIEQTSSEEIRPAELKQRLDQGDDVVILDVRGEEEFADWRIPGSVNVPLTEIEQGADLLEHEDRTIVTVCAAGLRSAKARRILEQRGFEAYNLHRGMMGWNRVFNAVPVDGLDLPGGTEILQIQRIGKGCLSYLIVSDGEALLVDPARDTAIYEELLEARDADLTAVIDTHAHADHVSGGPAMAKTQGVSYLLHPYDAIHPVDMLPAQIAYEPLKGDNELAVGDLRIEAIHAPGHTLGNLALLVDDQALLTGDTIFLDSIARPDLGGRPEDWTPLHHASLNRLLDLPDETLVLPGHFADLDAARQGVFAERLSALAKTNEGLRKVRSSAEDFQAYVLDTLPSFPDRYADIKRVNAGLLEADEERIEHLEFGEQQCAVS